MKTFLSLKLIVNQLNFIKGGRMTDFNKYRNASLSRKAHETLVVLSETLFPGLKLSISKTIEVLATKEIKTLESNNDNKSI